MDYGQFLHMLPEATLVVALIIMLFAGLLSMGNTKVHTLGIFMTAMLVLQIGVCAVSQPAEAFGGLYIATQATQAMKLILTFGTLLVTLVAQSWLERDAQKRAGEFHLLVLSTLLGMYVMISSGNFMLFFLGLEMASLPMACLVAFDKYKNRSAEAAAKFVLSATFSTGVMLYGQSILYGAVGTLYFNDVATAITSYCGNQGQLMMIIMGLVFFFSGLGFKLSLVPFHFWTADTYQGAPTAVTGYLSVVSKGAAAFALMVVLTRAFAPLTQYWEYLLYIVIVLSITISNLFAIRQSELKRFMAFSSISQAGYIMLATIGASQIGMASLMYYVLVYVVGNMTVFAVINTVEQHGGGGSTMITAYNGFYQTNRRLALLMTLALFSLAGIPPFAGMFSKFFVFMAAVKQGSFLAYLVVFIALINTVVSLYYYLLIVKAMYIKKSDNPLPAFTTDHNTRFALILTTGGIVLFGICSCIFNGLFTAASS